MRMNLAQLKKSRVRFALFLVMGMLFPFLGQSSGHAIEGGYSSPSLVGATVALVDSETGTSPYCSGMLLDENVIATAAHCVIDANGNTRSNIWISPAGADLSTSPRLTAAAQVLPC